MKKIIGISLLAASVVLMTSLSGCSKEFADFDGRYDASPSMSDAVGGEGGVFDGGEGGGESTQHGQNSGIVTAGEWNDIANWDFWSKLLNNQDWAGYGSYWKFYPRNFVYVELTDSFEAPVCGMKVSLEKDGQKVWEALSDNTGHAALWVNMSDDTFKVDAAGYTLTVNGKTYQDLQFTTPNTTELVVNKYTVAPMKVLDAIDVAFIVDATGSMTDEIDFLKDDLMEIIDFVGKQCTASVRTGTVFYRDEGDEYVTKYSQFTKDIKETSKYIGKQAAEGGGDWPEAVHKALAEGLQSLSWDTHNKSRVAFLILDAPPHHEDDIIASCQKSIAKYAEMGIKIVPVAASGIDKGTEYLLRSFAMATNGTYVFITNDSGVGNEHIEATVGEYEVEKLKDLIARLIIAYAK